MYKGIQGNNLKYYKTIIQYSLFMIPTGTECRIDWDRLFITVNEEAWKCVVSVYVLRKNSPSFYQIFIESPFYRSFPLTTSPHYSSEEYKDYNHCTEFESVFVIWVDQEGKKNKQTIRPNQFSLKVVFYNAKKLLECIKNLR